MTDYNYSFKMDETNVGKAVMRDVAVSPKQAMEVVAKLRGKTVAYAKRYLEEVIAMKRAVKYTRFTEGAGHKTAMGSGKYPLKAAAEVLKAIKSAESNASDKGLGDDLKIIHLSVQRASMPWHYGRQGRTKMKRIHIEVAVQEQVKKSTKKADVAKPVKKETVQEVPKTEAKTESKAQETNEAKVETKSESKTESSKTEEKNEDKQ